MHQQNKIDSRRQIGALMEFCYKVKVSSAFFDLVLKRQGDRLGHSENLFALFSAFRGSRLSIAEDIVLAPLITMCPTSLSINLTVIIISNRA